MGFEPTVQEGEEMTETARVAEVGQEHYRPEEAAKYLRIGRTTMFMRLKSKLIPSVALGRTRIIRKADLDAYIARKLEAAE